MKIWESMGKWIKNLKVLSVFNSVSCPCVIYLFKVLITCTFIPVLVNRAQTQRIKDKSNTAYLSGWSNGQTLSLVRLSASGTQVPHRPGSNATERYISTPFVSLLLAARRTTVDLGG